MYRIDNATAVAALPTPSAPGPNPDGYFTSGDPGSGIPATIVDDHWANAVQEEIANVIETAGITLDKADQTQLITALQAMFLGIAVTTPPQFDNDTSVATTEFVNRALGSYSSVSIEAADRALTAADDGKYIFINANNVDLTLPDPATLRQGTTFTIVQSVNNTGGTIVAPGGVTMNGVMNGSSSSPIAMMNKASYEVVRVSSTAYQVTVFGGTASLSTSGYQVLPSGIILQWLQVSYAASGAANIAVSGTWPIAFPTACRSVQLTPLLAAGTNDFATLEGQTTTGFTGNVYDRDAGGAINGTATLLAFAIGY